MRNSSYMSSFANIIVTSDPLMEYKPTVTFTLNMSKHRLDIIYMDKSMDVMQLTSTSISHL